MTGLVHDWFEFNRPQDGENHYCWGAILLWEEGGKQYQEHQPDLGPVKFYVAQIPG